MKKKLTALILIMVMLLGCLTPVLASSGNNYVAVVSLHSGSSVLRGFSNNYGELVTAINKVKSNGHTNMNSFLYKPNILFVSFWIDMKIILIQEDIFIY